MNIVMMGVDYVGLSTGLGFASLGHHVACVGKDMDVVTLLDRGQVPLYEPGMQEMLKIQQELGQVVFTTDLASVMSVADVVILSQAHVSQVLANAEEVGRAADHELTVLLTGMVPVGTTTKVIERIKQVLADVGRADLQTLIQIASVPSFVRQGTALVDFLNPDRIIIGADDPLVFDVIERLFDGLNAPMLRTRMESAELIKFASHAFFATKMAFAGELAVLCEAIGADVQEVVEGMGLDPRITPRVLRPGIGYGGPSFPAAISTLRSLANTHDCSFTLLDTVEQINREQRERFFQKIVHRLDGVQGRRLAVWGLSFKPETDDVTHSAAMDIVRMLYGYGADLVVYDPQAMPNAKRLLPEGIEFAPTPIDAAEGADALLVLTEWPEFQEVSFSTLQTNMVTPILFDGRNCLAHKHLASLGFDYHGVGLC